MAKKTNLDSNCTSFHDVTIQTTVAKLIELFPDSYEECNDGNDKTNFYFVLETENGDVFTIYDWKEYRPIELDELIHFHIGAHSMEVSEKALTELLKLL